jgi:hypothetical protein
MTDVDILIMLYLLCGALYSFTWYRQAESMALPAWRYCLQILMAFTGWPWLAITEWNMQGSFERFIEERDQDMREEMGLERNAEQVHLTDEQGERFQKFLEELLNEDHEDDLTSTEEPSE